MCTGLLRAGLLTVLLLVAVGCADAPVSPVPPPPSTDVDFARLMVPHHEQALELSALVQGRSTSTEVADLAFRIDREQVEEIGQLQGFLRLRGVGAASRTAGMGGMGGMGGMADAAILDRLRASSGADFDRLWLATMTAHHEGALAMARDHLRGPPGALTEFARTLLVTQQAEIDRMRGVLARS